MTKETAYRLGRNAGYYGINLKNCDFRIFAKDEFCKAWEKGKVKGELIKKRLLYMKIKKAR